MINTVLGPIEDPGAVSYVEALLSVFPGAQFAHDITIDRAAIGRVVVEGQGDKDA